MVTDIEEWYQVPILSGTFGTKRVMTGIYLGQDFAVRNKLQQTDVLGKIHPSFFIQLSFQWFSP